MRAIIKPAILAFGLAGAASALGVAPGLAQTPPPAPAAPATAGAAAQDAATVAQVALTPALVDQYIAAKKDIDAVLDKLPDGTDQPDPATMAKLDTVAKTYKFDGYRQFDTTESNIGIVLAGMDPATKHYVGPEAVIRAQIAQIQADKQMSAKDKKDTVDQLTAAIPTIPKLQFPGNVEVVAKNFDRLNVALPQD